MGKIKVTNDCNGIKGLKVIEPAVFGDARGYFMETYNQKDMEEAGLTMQFVQDNQSSSTKGVLRGLHFQKEYSNNLRKLSFHSPLQMLGSCNNTFLW